MVLVVSSVNSLWMFYMWERDGDGEVWKYHLVDVCVDFFWWDVAVFFKQLARIGLDLIIDLFIIPSILLRRTIELQCLRRYLSICHRSWDIKQLCKG